MMIRKIFSAAVVLVALMQPALAERADRDKPINVEAGRVTVDDAKKIEVLEGDVVLTKGTLIIQAAKVVITEDQYGFQKGTALGGKDGLARFRQKREGKDEYIEGEAERIEYNTRDEIAELFRRAWVKSGEDEVKGDYIWYDSVNEKYLVTAGKNTDPKGPPSRVRAVIQPKNKGTQAPAAPTKAGEEPKLRDADSLSKLPVHE